MKEDSRKIEDGSFTGKVIQITNVSPGATLQQMATLFGFLGTVTDIRLYPSDENIKVAVKLCYIQYDNSEQCGIAQHLTNTVFIDKALIVVPINRSDVPEENECVSLLKSINAYAGMPTAGLMNHIPPSDNEIPPLPPVPVITTATDPVEIDEIRRTIFVQNIPTDISADQLMAFFSGVGEVKYLRLCKGDTGKYAFVEFTAIEPVPTALQYNGVLFGGRCLRVDYSKHPIIKPESEQIAIGRTPVRKARESVLNPTINRSRRSRTRSPRSRSRTRRSRSRSIKRSPLRKKSISRSPRRKSISRSPIRKRSISRSPRRKRSISRSPRRRRSPSRFSNNGTRGKSRKDTELVNNIDRRRRSRRSISRSRSPRRKSRSISPRKKSKSRSPIKRSFSKSPIRRSKSASPKTKSKSRSPKRKSKSRSPKRKSKSRSPKRRSRSRSTRRRSRSKSPKRRSRTRSPRKKSRRRSKSRSKSPSRKKSKKSLSKSPERLSIKKKKKDKVKEKEKESTEEELQSLLTKIYTFEEEREKEKKSKEKIESSDESTKSKKKKKKSSSRE